MPTTTIRKADGSTGGNIVLSEGLFGAKINPGLMHQAVRNQAENSRQDTRNTKGRSDVAGGGKKPYRQKGTGRARQGSISAPHYRHGGVVFGPHPRDLEAHLTKKAKRAAILSALTARAADEAIIILDTLTIESHSTKTAAALLKSLGAENKPLIVLSELNLTIYKSFRNIPGAKVRVAPGISVRDILDAGHLIIVQSALDKMNAAWGKTTQEEAPAE
jgi:large subunit ribosomal protein L4